MSTRLYPLYQKGNPQLRIFLPNFWMKIVKPKEPIPPYMVLFQTSIEMTDYDVKNYLEKIYKIPIVEVKTTIKQGKIRKAYTKNYLVKEEDYKEALVTMPRHCKFTYPDFVRDVTKKERDEMLKLQDQSISNLSKTVKTSIDIPSWFQ